MTRYDAWAAAWALGAPVFRPLAEVSAERTVKADPNPTGWRQSGFMRVLIALLGTVGIALLVPLYVVALPVVLIWRAILAVTVWRRDTTRLADTRVRESREKRLRSEGEDLSSRLLIDNHVEPARPGL